MWVLVSSCERTSLLQYPFTFYSSVGKGVATSVLAYSSMSGLANKSASCGGWVGAASTCRRINSFLDTSMISLLSTTHSVTFVIRPQSVLSHLGNRWLIDHILCVNCLCVRKAFPSLWIGFSHRSIVHYVIIQFITFEHSTLRPTATPCHS